MMGAAATPLAYGRELEELVARQLAAEGYDVVLQPKWDDLPPDIARWQPDLLARRGDERLVVEVKARQPDGPARSRVDALAQAVGSHPSWRFRLVVAPPAEAAAEWSIEEVEQRVAEARTLAAAGHGEAALLLAWATCESAARALAAHERLNVQRWDAGAMLRQLVHGGLLDGSDLEKLDHARAVRNRLTHGLASGIDDPARLASGLLRIVDGLLAELNVDARDGRTDRVLAGE